MSVTCCVDDSDHFPENSRPDFELDAVYSTFAGLFKASLIFVLKCQEPNIDQIDSGIDDE